MFLIVMIGLIAVGSGLLFVSRAHPDGSPRIKSDAAAMFIAVVVTGLIGAAAVGLLERLL